MLRLSVAAELKAAAVVAANVGLGAVTPVLLHLGNHTTARLTPLPIVARIASGTSFDPIFPNLACEIAITRQLAQRSAPSVRPTSNVAPGPYVQADCGISLWDLVEGRTATSHEDLATAAHALRLVHGSLATVDADLPSYLSKVDGCASILASSVEAPRLATADRRFLAHTQASLRAALGDLDGRQQPLHGDAHPGNVLVSGGTATWMDFESACIGPVEWDIASLPASTWAHFPEADPAVLRLMADARSLCVSVWCWAEFDRSAAAAEAATFHLSELKARRG